MPVQDGIGILQKRIVLRRKQNDPLPKTLHTKLTVALSGPAARPARRLAGISPPFQLRKKIFHLPVHFAPFQQKMACPINKPFDGDNSF